MAQVHIHWGACRDYTLARYHVKRTLSQARCGGNFADIEADPLATAALLVAAGFKVEHRASDVYDSLLVLSYAE